MSTKLSFIQRVMGAMKGSDEHKISRFQKQAVKQADAQIKKRKEEIEEKSERINDIRDTMKEVSINLNVEELKTIESTQRYATNHMNKYLQSIGQVRDLEEQIETLNKEIEVFELYKAELV